MIELADRPMGRPSSRSLAAPYRLVAAQYQHVLFSNWPRLPGKGLRNDLRDLKLEHHTTLLGLHHFLTSAPNLSVPATLRTQLADLCDTLDPAFADPDSEVDLSGKTRIPLRDIDARFSHSVREGLQFIRKYKCLSRLDVDLLERLADADDAIGEPNTRRRKPQVATRLQTVVRDFACRLVRRSVGARSGVVRDLATLSDYERVVAGDDQLMYEAVKQVDGLLHEGDRFVVTLNTTFGEPLPPQARRVVLKTMRQKVRPLARLANGRPSSDLRFLSVGPQAAPQYIALTYELFRSVREMQGGMLSASLPRAVIAALDATRARLAGHIVRDEDELDGAEIRVGLRDEVIVREMDRFIVRKDGVQ
jgi:hypothetical protein